MASLESRAFLAEPGIFNILTSFTLLAQQTLKRHNEAISTRTERREAIYILKGETSSPAQLAVRFLAGSLTSPSVDMRRFFAEEVRRVRETVDAETQGRVRTLPSSPSYGQAVRSTAFTVSKVTAKTPRPLRPRLSSSIRADLRGSSIHQPQIHPSDKGRTNP